MAAPAHKAKDTKTGFTFRKFKDGDQEWPPYQSRIFTADATDKCPTYVHKTPPCQASCPSGEDIRGWLNIARGIEKPSKDMNWPGYALRRVTAGRAAAYQLRRKGHAVTMFDDHDELGGMAKYGVPGYRLPRESLNGEIDRIVKMGVEVKLKTRVGKGVALKEIESKYDAGLLAT